MGMLSVRGHTSHKDAIHQSIRLDLVENVQNVFHYWTCNVWYENCVCFLHDMLLSPLCWLFQVFDVLLITPSALSSPFSMLLLCPSFFPLNFLLSCRPSCPLAVLRGSGLFACVCWTSITAKSDSGYFISAFSISISLLHSGIFRWQVSNSAFFPVTS